MNYRVFLVEKAAGSDTEHYNLLNLLYDRPFYIILPEDRDRFDDARYLRELYLEENCEHSVNFPEFVTVLEVLLALSDAIDERIMGQMATSGPFWEMLDNLDLVKYTDFSFKMAEIDEILRVWLERKFEYNGLGSPFPLINKCHSDQRKVSLWRQMNGYVSRWFENGSEEYLERGSFELGNR